MQRSYKLLILSFFLLNLFLWVTYGEFIYGIPPTVKYVLSALTLSIILFYRLLYPSRPTPGRLLNPVVIVFLIWSGILLIYVILNPNSAMYPNLSFIQRILGQQYFFIPYILPIFILYTKFDLDFFSDLFHYSYFLIIPAILVQLIVISSGLREVDWLEQYSRIMIFDIGSGFLLLTAHLSKKKYIFNIVLFYTLLMIFCLAQWGRRAMLIDCILVMVCMIFLRLKSNFLNFNDRMKLYFVGLLLIILILSFGHLAKSSYVFQRGLNKEAYEETRGVVNEAFFLDFNSTYDLIFGRGIGGAILRGANSGNLADYIESGFLIVLLKGGLLYLIPFLILILRASYLGLWRSNNDLVKALAFQLLIYPIIMFAFNYPEFSTKYVFLWISISACLTPELRNASNEEIYKKINFRSDS